jgi:integrase
MSTLSKHLADYLAMRRALGFKLQRPAGLLAEFVAYLDQAGAERVTTQHALCWATLPDGADRAWHGARLAAVRPFARYLATIEAGTEVPPAGLLPARAARATPYLYSPAQIDALIAAASKARWPLVDATYRSLIGLLAVTGMRVGEAIGLDRDDLDLAAGIVTVRQGKFGKSRQLPLHCSTVTALQAYAVARDRRHRHPRTAAWFVSGVGTRLIYQNVHYRFHRLIRVAGLVPRSPSCRPRIHDLRHTFAVNTLLGWYRTGADVQAKLPLLSTWLGHVHPGCTYWYLTATPQLLTLAADRLPPIGQVS